MSHSRTKRKVHHGTPISSLLDGDGETQPLPEKKRRRPKKDHQRPGKHKTVRRNRRPSQGGRSR